jgi:hypothetical protein
MGKYFSMRSVPRSEFEALRRFPEYTQLNDAILSRLEPDGHEFRVFDEDVDRFHIGPMTPALQNELIDYYRRHAAQTVNPDQVLDLDAEPLDTPAARKQPPLAQEQSQKELFPPPPPELA